MAATAEATAEKDPIAELVAKGEHREAAALAARTHGAALGRLCMAFLGVQAEAEEAVQDTLLIAHDGFGSYRAEGTVRAWIFGIGRRVCARRLESRSQGVEKLRLLHDADAEAGLPDEQVAAARRARAVREALVALNPTEREAVVLRFEAGLSYREIAQACGVEEATARKRCSRALFRLRELLHVIGGDQ